MAVTRIHFMFLAYLSHVTQTQVEMVDQSRVGGSGTAGLTMLVVDTVVVATVLLLWCGEGAGQGTQDGGHGGDGGGQVSVSVVCAPVRIIIIICQHHRTVHHDAGLSGAKFESQLRGDVGRWRGGGGLSLPPSLHYPWSP